MKRTRKFLQWLWQTSAIHQLIINNEFFQSDAHRIVSRKGMKILNENEKIVYYEEDED